ncbi:MAG: MBOAT family protein, partial [Lachnospiraceae bacterium]|nr:MBOAT family protein [Lachnospiraceae bacterium]
MLFNSYIFILLFIPLCLLGYFLLNRFKFYIPAQFFLFGMSLWFYGYFNYRYLLIIIVSIFANYGLYVFIGKFREQNKALPFLIAGIVFNLGVLGFFKYTDFFIDTVNQIFKSDLPLLKIVLPLGISFFT